LRISELADAVGVAASTVRYYERIGLVPEPARTESGYRVYTRDAEARLRFIVRAKRLGLSLEQVGELLGVWNGENCAATQEHLLHLLDAKQAQITADIAELRSFSAQLRDVQQQLATTAPPASCTPELDCCAPRIADASAGGTGGEPIACTLAATGITARLAEFADLFRGALVGRDTTADGIRFRFANAAGREEKIRELARCEQTCCSFFRFEIAVHGEEVWWDTTVDDPKARPLLDDFRALPARLGVATQPAT
jgi:DNA-binding transcriptional MerR regulator